MRAGQLSERIELQTRSATLDAFGQRADTWATTATLWARVRPMGGAERERSSQQIGADISHAIDVRWNAALFSDPLALAAQRIKYGTRLFNIINGRNVDEANAKFELLCTEGSRDGQ